jgi:hypothetical protein
MAEKPIKVGIVFFMRLPIFETPSPRTTAALDFAAYGHSVSGMRPVAEGKEKPHPGFPEWGFDA